MSSPTLQDLRALYFGVTPGKSVSDAEYAFLLGQAQQGITGAGLLAIAQTTTPVLPRVGDFFFTTHFSKGTAVAVLNRLMYAPINVPVKMTLDQIGAELTAVAVTSVLRLGLYASRPDGWPGALLVDAGTIDGTVAPGVKNLPINVVVEPGNYWAASVGQGATGNATWRIGNTGIHLPNTAGMASVGFMYPGFVEVGVAGALPAVANPTVPNFNINAMQVRRAA